MLTDIQIAQQTPCLPITEIAKKLNIEVDDLEMYGKYKAKLPLSLNKKYADRENGKLILVTAINPTPAGEGKTTITVGLGQAMNKIGKNAPTAARVADGIRPALKSAASPAGTKVSTSHIRQNSSGFIIISARISSLNIVSISFLR